MNKKKNPAYYNKIDKRLTEIATDISVLHSITPKNVIGEKKKFFQSQTYNPQFTYRKKRKTDIEKIYARLNRMKFDESVMGILLQKKRDDTILRLKIIESVGTDDFYKYSVELYGKPDKRLMKKAESLITLKTESDKGETFETKMIKAYFQTAFVKYGIQWKIKTKDMVANAAVNGKTKTLYIKKNSRFTQKFMRQLVVHEIGTHILRVENGLAQPYSLFAKGLPGYLPTEEGLALYNQEIHGCMNPRLFKMYAGRVFAIQYASTSSFRETYTKLLKYFKPKQAWTLTLRAKRGMTDTEQPGAFTKDHVYLKGYYLIHAFLKKGGNIKDLYYGKIGVEHVNLIKQIPDLVHPQFLPLQRYFGYFISIIEDVFSFPINLLKTFFHSRLSDTKKFFKP